MKNNENQIKKWKKVFSDNKDKLIKANQNKASLTFFKKEPVTFQLSRTENPVDFERMLFVIKACIKTGVNNYKSVLHIERSRKGSRLIASDGLRMHYAEITKKIVSGNYKPHVTKDFIYLGKPVEKIKFPQWAKVIPLNTEQKTVINLKDTGLRKDRKENERLSLAFNDFLNKTGEPINIRYLEDLTKREWVVFSQSGKKKAIVLKEKSGNNGRLNEPLAVILPIMKAA